MPIGGQLMPRLLPDVQPGQCWIEGNRLCTREFLFGVKERRAYFVVRSIRNCKENCKGRLRERGKTETGTVYKQADVAPAIAKAAACESVKSPSNFIGPRATAKPLFAC